VKELQSEQLSLWTEESFQLDTSGLLLDFPTVLRLVVRSGLMVDAHEQFTLKATQSRLLQDLGLLQMEQLYTARTLRASSVLS
jgi:hypothetical protein